MCLDEIVSYFADGATRPHASQKTVLADLRQVIERDEAGSERALETDLGRPAFEAYAFEIAPVIKEIETLEKNLERWTKTEKTKTPLILFSAVTEVRTVPYGLALIIAPWNYPFLLLMQPLAAAVACGNVVAEPLKPSG